ncbi:PAAR domain-containing protein [Paraburkholderia sediminicola]|uniref:PAAR domain-containing protein n=1 Tax=Paraburkholderia sediminicola TaxID=458836 RepID=UPI0038B7F191
MMRLVLCAGDQPETGGYIEPMAVGVPSSIMGHPVAFIGGAAFCNACSSVGVIAKAGGPRRRKHCGTEIALEGDILLCKCPTPPRMVAATQSISRHNDMAESMGTVTSSRTSNGEVSSVAKDAYDEQIEAKQGRLFEGYPYFIETEDGRVFSGRLDSGRLLPRVYTEASAKYIVFWGDHALAKQQGN